MGGAGLPFGLILIAVLVVIALAAFFVVVPWLRGESRLRARLTDSAEDALIYEVPEGQDPASIVAALRHDGLDAIEVMRQGRQRVVISGPSGVANLRPRARAVIAEEAGLNLEGDPAQDRKVTFVDE